jgi:hypothetical protein
LLFIAVFLVQCKKGNVQPKVPAEKYLHTDMEIQNEKYLSTVNIPVAVSLAELEKQINAQLKGLIYEDNSYENDGNDNLKAKVWKLSDIKIQAQDSAFLFEVPIKIWASAGYKVSPLGVTLSGYKDTEFSMKIRFMSRIGITPDWKVKTTTLVEGYDWIVEPSVKVAGIAIPIKSMISRMLRKNFDKITQAIDKQVGDAVEIREYVQQAWDLARQPRLISKDYGTWLVIVPTAVVMSPFKARNNMIHTTIGLKGYSQTVTSVSKPEARGRKELPSLEIVNHVPGQFKIGLISLISYKDAALIARGGFIGEKFSSGGYAVEITDIDFYGQDEKLIIKVGLKGSINGDIYLKGIPFYDPHTKKLTLNALEYDLDTRNVITKTANWLLKGKFRRMLEDKLVFSVGDQIEEARKNIQKVLKSYKVAEGIEVNGTLNQLEPDHVYLTPDNIYSVVFASGNVHLTVDQLK